MRTPDWIATPGWPRGVSAEIDSPEPGSGVVGNARLTSAIGIVLLVLLAVEGVTLLDVRTMIVVHVFVGVMLAGPVLLKIGSTVYRFLRYYTGAGAYRRKGPPPVVLRVSGPVLILSTVALLGTGVWLIVAGPQAGAVLLTAHQTSFWVWVVLLGVHVLAHVWEAIVTSWTELRRSMRGRAARDRSWRYALVAVAVVVGIGGASLLVSDASAWSVRQVPHRTAPAALP